MQWTQKLGDQGLQWIGEVNLDGTYKTVSARWQGKCIISRDNAIHTVYLEIKALAVGDSGIYYCSSHSETEPYTKWKLQLCPHQSVELLVLWKKTCYHQNGPENTETAGGI